MLQRILGLLVMAAGSWGLSFSAHACSCSWNGPFLAVAKEAPLIVRARVTRHDPGTSPAMDVVILETLRGAVLDSGMVVHMGDGMLCRPPLESFPVGTEWILALNGPGSKPAEGPALSHCGEYWLRVENGDVVGSLDGSQTETKRMSLDELKRRLLYPRFQETFRDRVDQGKRYARPFGPRFVFVLEPSSGGWEIRIEESGREENLARLTPPLHFVPNPRFIEGWHFLDDPSRCPTREYSADAGPGNPREFIFSPEVGKSLAGPEDIEAVEQFGRGGLTIEKFQLAPGEGGCPEILWLEFSVRVEGGY